MPIISRMAKNLGIPPQDIITILSLLAFAIISGIGAVVVRGEIFQYQAFGANLVLLQFSLTYMLLGLLPLLFVRAEGTEGRGVSIFLFITIVIGLSIRPQIDTFNLIVAFLVLLGGLTYFNVFQTASNSELLIIIMIIILETYLFSMLYMWSVLQSTGDLRLAGLTMVYLTVGILLIGRLLIREYRKASAGSGYNP